MSSYETQPGAPNVPPPGFGPPSQSIPPQRRRARSPAISAAAIFLAFLAIVLSIVGLTRRPVTGQGQNDVPRSASTSEAASPDGATADRVLCNAIAPLMKQSTDDRNALVNSGPPGSPDQDAALPGFISKTTEWAGKAQKTLDEHSDPPRHLTRTLQRYIDDMQLFTESVRPGPGNKYDEAAWVDSTVALGGPMRVCYDLGVQW